MVKSVSLYLRKEGMVFILVSSESPEGWWVYNGNYLKSSLDNKATLVEKIKQGLDLSVMKPNGQSNFRIVIKHLLKVAGISSWSKFCDKSKCITISASEKGILFIPHKNLGGRKGFLTTRDHKTIEIYKSFEDIKDTEIYNSVMECFENSQTNE